jgi:hypothetical protein
MQALHLAAPCGRSPTDRLTPQLHIAVGETIQGEREGRCVVQPSTGIAVELWTIPMPC